MTTKEPQGITPTPADPADFPPQLQEALRRTVAEDGRLTTDVPDEALVACTECARAIALGWWGSISRHVGPADKPVCVLCGEGAAVHTAADWFTITAKLIEQRIREGQRRTWTEDAHIGLGIRPSL